MITHDLRVIADAILDKKGNNVVSLDLRSIDGAICDWFVVCDGSNTTQVSAISDNIEKVMKEEGHRLLRSQGEENGFWIIKDYGNILVHIFLREYRDFYRLEDLWSDVPRKEYKYRKPVKKNTEDARQHICTQKESGQDQSVLVLHNTYRRHRLHALRRRYLRPCQD